MKILTYLINYYGLNWKKNLPSTSLRQSYQQNRIPVKTKLSEEEFKDYDSYISDLLSSQSSRFTSIETKSGQIVGQTSLALTIVGLFIPFAFEKVQQSQPWLKIILVTGIIVIFLFLIYAIICAFRNFNIKRFPYVSGCESTILDSFNKKVDFKVEVLNDKIYEFRVNSHLTNVKGSNVLYAYRSFKTSLVILIFYILFYCVNIIYVSPTTKNNYLDLSPNTTNTLKQALDSCCRATKGGRLDSITYSSIKDSNSTKNKP